jgi:hypothetical protein
MKGLSNFGILKVKITLVISEYCATKKKCYCLYLHSTESCATLAQTPVLFVLSGQVNELYQKHPRPFLDSSAEHDVGDDFCVE